MTQPPTGPSGYGYGPVPQQQNSALGAYAVQPSPQVDQAWQHVGYQPPPEPVGFTYASDPPSVEYEPYPHQTIAVPSKPYGMPYRPYAAPMPQENPGQSIGTAGLVIGTVGWILPYIGVVAPIVGLVLSIVGYQRSKQVSAPTGVSVAGIVVSSIILLLGALLVAGLVLFSVSS